MPDIQHNNNKINIAQLSAQQRHDIAAALLSIQWAADLLKPADGTEPPVDLIYNQLNQSYRLLKPVIEQLLNAPSEQSGLTSALKGTPSP
jgi:hypothetical protein